MKTLRPNPWCFISILIMLLSCQPQPDNGSNDIESEIDEVFEEYNSTDKPGAAVAVVKDGKIVFKKGYGSANLEYDIPVTPSTIFHIASVSKQFTAFSILLLADEGKLNFDDDIRDYIPEVPDFGKTITLRHLASHTSGLRDQWNLLALAGWRLDDVITKEHVLKLVSKQKELNFEPGEEYVYCNTGFTLLAEVVARVSGMPFREFTKTRIFNPLGMNNTLFYDDHERIVRNRAYSYYAVDSGYKKSVLSYANAGATSLFTTVEDLSLWALNFESAKVGNTEIINELNTLAKLNNGETFGGAYGQFINEYKGLKQIQHGGADAGYRTYLARFPDQKYAVSVFSNLAQSNPPSLALAVTDIFLKNEIQTDNNQEEVVKEKPVFISLSEEQMDDFIGAYWNEAESYSRRIYLEDDTLRYGREINNSPLVPINENTFHMLTEDADVQVSFKNDASKKIMEVIVDGGEPIISEYYNPSNYSNEDLMEFAGTFYSDELSTSYKLVVKNDSLFATHSRHEDIVVTPIKQDTFSANRWFFGLVEFERDNSNSISGFRVSSGRVRNLYFQRIDDK